VFTDSLKGVSSCAICNLLAEPEDKQYPLQPATSHLLKKLWMSIEPWDSEGQRAKGGVCSNGTSRKLVLRQPGIRDPYGTLHPYIDYVGTMIHLAGVFQPVEALN
jgi:hypothetical protein